MHPYDDELERALFALPLEEPPRDLRKAILAATVYRPAFPVKAWEMWVAATVVAVAVWLCISVARGAMPQFVHGEATLAQVLASPAAWPIFFWTLVGGAAAAWVSQLPLTIAAGYARTIRR